MKKEDKPRFATILTGVADYYGKELSVGAIGLYWQGLLQYDLSAVEKALWLHTQNPDTGQFMPKIADIVKLVSGGNGDQAMAAWAKVDQAVRQVGTYADVVFDDAIIHRVIAEMGGWVWLGRQTEHEWPFVAKRFEQAYRAYKLRGDTPAYQPILIGIANAQNAQHNFQIQPPILIGNTEIAEMVMKGGTNQPLIQMKQASSEVEKVDERISKLITDASNL